jgi:hypothetical protein
MLRLHVIAPRDLRHVRPHSHALRNNPRLRLPRPTPSTNTRCNHIQTLHPSTNWRDHHMFEYITIIHRSAYSPSGAYITTQAISEMWGAFGAYGQLEHLALNQHHL